MRLWTPPEDRLRQAAASLAPYGFTLDTSRATALRAYEPFLELASPNHYVAGAFGDIEGTPIEAFEYTYGFTDSDGNTSHYDQLVVAVQHLAIRGTASFRDDPTEWSSAAAFLDAFLWLPPFTLLKAIQLYNEAKNPDRGVGDADFDRLYVVHAASATAAPSSSAPAPYSTPPNRPPRRRARHPHPRHRPLPPEHPPPPPHPPHALTVPQDGWNAGHEAGVPFTHSARGPRSQGPRRLDVRSPPH